jgi:Heterodisulfide reductase, subunit A and related polyferredoxins
LFEKKLDWFSGASGVLRFIQNSPKSVDNTITSFGENTKNFNVNNKCTGCASCKKICPVDNIQMKNEQPNWEKRCEQCMACIQWCPSQAIQYANKTEKRNRYHNPEVKISDMISNSFTN